jgi:hypothetical protein
MTTQHVREQIDIAYDRGFTDGSGSGPMALIAGLIIGACVAACGFWIYLS